MTQWQDIASAPKDGTCIEVRQGSLFPCHARFVEGRWEPIEFNGTDRPTLWRPVAQPTMQPAKEEK